MMTRTIRDVDDKTWRKLKILSADHEMTMGRLLKKMTEEYEVKSKEFWKAVLEGEKIISDREAEELKAVSREIRKEHGFR